MIDIVIDLYMSDQLSATALVRDQIVRTTHKFVRVCWWRMSRISIIVRRSRVGEGIAALKVENLIAEEEEHGEK